MSLAIIKDLRSSFGEARDQGQRPTCMAFAASDAHAAARTGVFCALSTEYLYYHAVHHTKPPRYRKGVSLESVCAVVNSPGQPLETAWLYMPALPAKDSDWNPPKSAINYRATVTHTLIKPTAIIEVLDQDRACILTMNITRSFYTPDNEGVVAAVNGDPLTGCHAVVAIGYGSLNGNMMLLVRNSWGVDWGLRGYGWLHQEYVTTNLRSVSTIAAIY